MKNRFKMTAKGGRPPDFDPEELKNDGGIPIAHVAATSGHLPEGFDRWDPADDRGRTVAEAKAEFERLRPPPEWARPGA